jgi:hypothetical protein
MEKHEGLQLDEMVSLWKEVSRKKGGGKPKKRSAYMNFSQAVSAQIKEEHPEMTFGQRSTETSRRWKLLTKEEQAGYALAASPAPKKTPPSPVLKKTPQAPLKKKPSPVLKKPSPVVKKAGKEEYLKMKVQDLKKVCKDKGLSVKGLKKKEEFLEALESAGYESDSASDSESDSETIGGLEEEEEDILA